MAEQARLEVEDINQHWVRTEGGFALKSERCNWAKVDFMLVDSGGHIRWMLSADAGAESVFDHHTAHFLACRLQEAHVLAQSMRMGWLGNGR